ncbi:uncharacterized protein METZ01_LOCUS75878, partial [marine metagenome]
YNSVVLYVHSTKPKNPFSSIKPSFRYIITSIFGSGWAVWFLLHKT